jgi:hypothetical protein
VLGVNLNGKTNSSKITLGSNLCQWKRKINRWVYLLS